MKRVLLVLVLVACGKSSTPPANTGGNGGPSTYDERQACSIDSDCIPVEVDCCDHCNGGTIVGVHRDHAVEVQKQYAGRPECQGAACTERACVERPVGICRQSICGVRLGTREDVTPLPRL